MTSLWVDSSARDLEKKEETPQILESRWVQIKHTKDLQENQVLRSLYPQEPKIYPRYSFLERQRLILRKKKLLYVQEKNE